MIINPWTGVFIVFLSVGILFFTVYLIQRKKALDPEVSRKVIHVGSGLIACSFPFIFHEAWPVLIITGASLSFTLSSQISLTLKNSIGKLVTGVKRKSIGDILFPAGVAVLFLLSHGNKVLYLIPLLVLTFADALAALVGLRYGSLYYVTSEGKKTTEGSVAFFLTAFLSTMGVLSIFTRTGIKENLLIALFLGFLLMLLEAIAWRGLDNIFIPLIGWFILERALGMGTHRLMIHLIITGLLLLFVIVWKKHATLDDSALFGSMLVLYLCWSLGDLRWFIPPFILFVTYAFLSPKTELDHLRVHNIHVVLSISSAGLFWFFLSKTFSRPDFIYLFVLAFSTELAMISLARLKRAFPKLPAIAIIIASVLKTWVLMFPAFYFARENASFSRQYLFALFPLSVASLLFYLTQPNLKGYPNDTGRWIRQVVLGGVASLSGFWVV